MSAKKNLGKLGSRKTGSLTQKLKEEDKKKSLKRESDKKLWLFLP